MSWIAHTFEELGRSIGVSRLLPDANGRLSLQIGDDRRLDFHVLEDAVLLLLVRPIERNDRLLTLRRALDACHLRHGWSLPVRAGLSRDGQLVFIARMHASEFRTNTVEQAFDLLTRLHDRVTRR
jgi:type III secretion system chaperone SycN